MENIEGKIEHMPKPKAKFELLTIEDEVKKLMNFCYGKSSGGWDWSHYVYKQHPKLEEMTDGIENEEDFYNQCRKYAEVYLKENRKTLEKAKEKFEKSWAENEEEVYTTLSRDFETDFPEGVSEIRARISINPINPRYLDKWSYDVFYRASDDRMKEISIHEIIHFLYFKKWLEVFPNYDKKTFNGPHSEWKLSEILVNPIMNNNPIIQKIVNGKQFDGYKEFQKIKIGDETLNEFFGNIYREHLEGKISFADFIKRAWDEYQKHQDLFVD